MALQKQRQAGQSGEGTLGMAAHAWRGKKGCTCVSKMALGLEAGKQDSSNRTGWQEAEAVWGGWMP